MAIKMTRDEYEQKYGVKPNFGAPEQTSAQQKEPGALKRIRNVIGEKQKQVGETIASGISGEQGVVKTGLVGTSQAFGALPEVVTAAMPKPVRKASEFVGEKVGQAFQGVTNAIGGTQAAQNFVTKNPNVAAATEDVLGYVAPIGEIAGAVAGTKGTVKGIQNIPKTVAKTGQAISRAGKALVKSKAGQAISNTQIPKAITNTGRGIGIVGKQIATGVKNIPGRISTNVAEMGAAQDVIKKLPTRVARQAVDNGVDVGTVQKVYNIPKTQRPAFKKLAQVAKNFSEGNTKLDPTEVVGQPIVKRLKKLDMEASAVGKKLGEAANNLGDVSSDEAIGAVANRMKKIRGLEGVALDADGNLDFSNTSLASELSASDQSILQKAFSAATKSGNGKQKHLLRQELFEQLNGRKRSLTQLTETQEKGLEAIRQGLADVLEAKSPGYRSLNQQYAKIVQPVSELRKMMRVNNFTDSDILDMKAGLLARRLTSFAKTNPEIRQLLRKIDSATAMPGKTTLSVEALQDFYNALDDVYGISRGTSFQGQIIKGIDKGIPTSGGDITARAMQAVGEFAGKTPAVKRKAFENVLSEVFDGKKQDFEISNSAIRPTMKSNAGFVNGAVKTEKKIVPKGKNVQALEAIHKNATRIAGNIDYEDLNILQEFSDAVVGKRGKITADLKSKMQDFATASNMKNKAGTDLALAYEANAILDARRELAKKRMK